MRLTSLTVRNFKSHEDTGPIELGPVTLLVGPNNAGKSALLDAVELFERSIEPAEVRLGALEARVVLGVSGLEVGGHWFTHARGGLWKDLLLIARPGKVTDIASGNGMIRLPGELKSDTERYIVRYRSERNVSRYSEDVSLAASQIVGRDLEHLAARVSIVANPSHPRHDCFARACRSVLGREFATVPTANGQVVGLYVDDERVLKLEFMGTGVAGILGLITELALADDRLFLIESLENDCHPLAVRRLADLILESSTRNQFVITTNSDVVTGRLGPVPETRTYAVSLDPALALPTSRVEPADVTDPFGLRMSV